MAPVLSKRTKVALVVGAILLTEKKKKKRVWSKEWLKQRAKYTHLKLLQCVRSCEPPDFVNYLRMNYQTFMELLKLVTPYIERENTLMRDAVTAEERLVATLSYLATGRSYEDLKYSCVISLQLLGKIIPETCRAIYDVLKKQYICFPSKEEEWIKIASDFKEMWQCENCTGAVDGKHVAIKPPPGSGSYFYNYKQFQSIVLLGIVNDNYEFIYVSVGTNGRVSDGGVIKCIDFYSRLTNNTLQLPEPNSLRGIPDKMPHVFIGDEAFALMPNCMVPYRYSSSAGYGEKVFNYRLSRARRVVENAFGIMGNRFRVLLTPIATDVKTVDDIVLACCVLHNFLRRQTASYIAYNSPDTDNIVNGNVHRGDWHDAGELTSLQVTRQFSVQVNAKQVRDKYKEYYNNAGKVEFQHRFVH